MTNLAPFTELWKKGILSTGSKPSKAPSAKNVSTCERKELSSECLRRVPWYSKTTTQRNISSGSAHRKWCSCDPKKLNSIPSQQKSFIAIKLWQWFHRHERGRLEGATESCTTRFLEMEENDLQLLCFDGGVGLGFWKKVLGTHGIKLWGGWQIGSGNTQHVGHTRIMKNPLRKAQDETGKKRGSRTGWGWGLYNFFEVQIISSWVPDARHEAAKLGIYPSGFQSSQFLVWNSFIPFVIRVFILCHYMLKTYKLSFFKKK